MKKKIHVDMKKKKHSDSFYVDKASPTDIRNVQRKISKKAAWELEWLKKVVAKHPLYRFEICFLRAYPREFMVHVLDARLDSYINDPIAVLVAQNSFMPLIMMVFAVLSHEHIGKNKRKIEAFGSKVETYPKSFEKLFGDEAMWILP